jgi:MFS family permease
VLGYVCTTFSLAQSMLFPAIPDLIEGLDATANDVAWAFTGFGIAAVVATPLMGRLGDMFGKRRMLVVALMAFTLERSSRLCRRISRCSSSAGCSPGSAAALFRSR